MPPEQAHGAAPDPRQDLYAAGVVAGQLLSGRAPSATRPTPRPSPTARCGPLLEALVATDPDLRPPSAAAALQRLRRIDVTSRRAVAGRARPGRGSSPPTDGRADAVIAASVLVSCALRRRRLP